MCSTNVVGLERTESGLIKASSEDHIFGFKGTARTFHNITNVDVQVNQGRRRIGARHGSGGGSTTRIVFLTTEGPKPLTKAYYDPALHYDAFDAMETFVRSPDKTKAIIAIKPTFVFWLLPLFLGFLTVVTFLSALGLPVLRVGPIRTRAGRRW